MFIIIPVEKKWKNCRVNDCTMRQYAAKLCEKHYKRAFHKNRRMWKENEAI